MTTRRSSAAAGVDYEALAAWFARHDPPSVDWPRCADAIPVGWIARRIHRPTVVVYRWRDAGLVPAVEADRAAIELGVHPLHIWLDFHRDVA